MTLDDHDVHQKLKMFREGFALDYVWPSFLMALNAGTSRKKVSLGKKAVKHFIGILWVIGEVWGLGGGYRVE